MNLLTLLFPRVRAEILRLLFAVEGRELHLRAACTRPARVSTPAKTSLTALSILS